MHRTDVGLRPPDARVPVRVRINTPDALVFNYFPEPAFADLAIYKIGIKPKPLLIEYRFLKCDRLVVEVEDPVEIGWRRN